MAVPGFCALNLPTRQESCTCLLQCKKLLSSWTTGIKNVHILNFENYYKISLKMSQLYPQMATKEIASFPAASQIADFRNVSHLGQCDSPNYCLKLYFFCFWVWSFFHVYQPSVFFNFLFMSNFGGGGDCCLLLQRAHLLLGKKLWIVKHYRSFLHTFKLHFCYQNVYDCYMSKYIHVRFTASEFHVIWERYLYRVHKTFISVNF